MIVSDTNFLLFGLDNRFEIKKFANMTIIIDCELWCVNKQSQQNKQLQQISNDKQHLSKFSVFCTLLKAKVYINRWQILSSLLHTKEMIITQHAIFILSNIDEYICRILQIIILGAIRNIHYMGWSYSSNTCQNEWQITQMYFLNCFMQKKGEVKLYGEVFFSVTLKENYRKSFWVWTS